MLAISWTVDGKDIQRALDAVAQRVNTADESKEGFEFLLKAAANALRESWRRNFDTQGSVLGKWQPLAASTLKEHRAQGLSSVPLVMSGLMKANFESERENYDIEGRTVKWSFSNYRGFQIHHFGSHGTVLNKNLFRYKDLGTRRTIAQAVTQHEPARKLVGINSTNELDVENVIARRAKTFVDIVWTGGG